MYPTIFLTYCIYSVFSFIFIVQADDSFTYVPEFLSPPSNIQVCNRTEISITVCWHSPIVAHGVNITSYYILYENAILSIPRPTIKELHVPPTVNSMTIPSLNPGDPYDFAVVTEYMKQTNVSSAIQTARTRILSECHCFFPGSVNTNENCTANSSCSCQPGYTGSDCEVCQDKFYLTLEERCLPCPCTNTSTQHCFAKSGRVECEQCLVGYAKPLCLKCDVNYFRKGELCVMCDCNGNGLMIKGSLCDSQTGHCLKCMGNTVGEHCEHCAPGYHGDAKRAKNCTKIHIQPHIPAYEEKQHLGTILGVCLIVLLIMIIGGIFLCYKYCRYSTSPIISFWNMQLKEETVNLKSMQDYHILEDSMEEIPVRTELTTIRTISKEVEDDEKMEESE